MKLGSHRILVGDVRAKLAEIAPGSVQCVVTSPPYWNLRDYGVPGQLGNEKTPEEYLANQVEVFRGVRETMHETATLWLNMGDSYAQDKKWGGTTGGKHANGLHGATGIGRKRTNTGLKAGDLCNMPHRLASALQADGWYWRSTIIWKKPSPMPESIAGWRWVRCRVKVGEAPRRFKGHERLQGDYAENGKDFAPGAKFIPCPGCSKCSSNNGLILRRGKWRPTTGHEYIFLFSKSERYWADGDAVQEAAQHAGLKTTFGKTNDPAAKLKNGHTGNMIPGTMVETAQTRNPRSVWTISSEPLKEKHFAAYPTELVRRCIMAGTSSAGCCPACRMPWSPVVESERIPTRPGKNTKIKVPGGWDTSPGAHGSIHQNGRGEPQYLERAVTGNRDDQRHVAVSRITGYRPSCSCDPGEAIPCLVLDPYLGSGTTAQVANYFGIDAIGCELNPEYAKLAELRISQTPRCVLRELKRQTSRVFSFEDDGLFTGIDE